jgi:hypothetical protein
MSEREGAQKMSERSSKSLAALFLGAGFLLSSGASNAKVATDFVPEKHEARSMKFWSLAARSSFETKLHRHVPSELIDYLRKDNKAQGWPNIPEPAELTDELYNEVRTALDEIPQSIMALINKKLVGVFFVKDLGGSGYSESVLDKDGRPKMGFVVIDATVLSRAANKWATWKESSPYRSQSDFKLEAIIAERDQDTRKNAIQYILLHEFGHILSIGNPMLPRWGVDPKEVILNPLMTYFHESWKRGNNSFVSKYDDNWSERSAIQFYAEESRKKPLSIGLKMYRTLLMTNFPTPYAATNPHDDFAEAFVNYVHVVMLKKPWSIVISSKKETIKLMPCWQENRCKKKREILESLFSNLSSAVDDPTRGSQLAQTHWATDVQFLR